MDSVVDIVAILAAPVFGLLGVWIGGVIQSRKEELRLDREERMNREARFFRHKEDAYTAALQAYAKARSLVWNHRLAPSAADPDVDFLEDAAAVVRVIGSKRAAEAVTGLERDLLTVARSRRRPAECPGRVRG